MAAVVMRPIGVRSVTVLMVLEKWRSRGATDERVSLGGRLRPCGHRMLLVLAVILCASITVAQDSKVKDSVVNPHGDSARCDSCHISADENGHALRFDGNVPQLCQSCHDGHLAKREVHPVNIVPSEKIMHRIPSGFPLEDGMLTCSTCHDVTWRCSTEPSSVVASGSQFLRGGQVANAMTFCFHCHAQKDYISFNPHEQLKAKEPQTETCLWCHASAPDLSFRFGQEASYSLRGTSGQVCRNCHRVSETHPTGGSHMEAIPNLEMTWRMSAYEMQSTMRLPFPQLLKYARATERTPRSMPLSENGRITCHTCHNPHEKGLLPARNPRSTGAEPKHATNHRLRVHQDNICVACHEK